MADMCAAFEPLSPVNFRFDRLEINPRFATIARAANAGIVTRFRIDMEDRGGRLELMLPYATIEPVRELLLQMFMGEKFGRDSIWEFHLASELWMTDVTIEAVLDQQSITLSNALALKVGQQIMLNTVPNGDVKLVSGGVPMFVGKMGQKGGKIAVRIDRPVKSRRGPKAA